MLTPALRRMATDRRLGSRAIRVYAYLADQLDFHDYRPVKILSLHRELCLNQSHVSETLRQLRDLGYLDRNGRDGPRGAYKYRLVYSVR